MRPGEGNFKASQTFTYLFHICKALKTVYLIQYAGKKKKICAQKNYRLTEFSHCTYTDVLRYSNVRKLVKKNLWY